MEGAGFAANSGHVLLVDPAAGAVKGTLAIGYAPEFTLAPDGRTFYVVSTWAGTGRLRAYDSLSGRVLSEVGLESRLSYTLWSGARGLAVSPDGKWLFLENMRTLGGHDEYSLQRFDIGGTNLAAAGSAALPECGIGAVITLDRGSNWDVLVHCPFSNMIRLVRFDAEGKSQIYDTVLPQRLQSASGERMQGYGRGSPSLAYAGGGEVLATTAANELCTLTIGRQTPVCSALPELGATYVVAGEWPMAGHLLYCGTTTDREKLAADATDIRIIDTTKAEPVRTIHAAIPFDTLAVSSQGRRIYAANPEMHTLVTIDSSTGQEIGRMTMPGSYPAVIIPVP
jgi:DNA-binding beta-propeller fold protein YncE